MNTSTSTTTVRPPSKRRWLWALLALPPLLFILLVAGVANCFRVSNDLKDLRADLNLVSAADWHQRIGIHADPLVLRLVHLGICAVHVDPQLRAALQALHGLDVGVYQLATGARKPSRSGLLTATDASMAGRDWERVLGVQDQQNLVALYVPRDSASTRHMQCCLMVYDGKQLVLVSARTNPQPLVDLALNQPSLFSRTPFLAQR